ncbi:MAG TPA: ornithine cyclodeaminase family protein [Vicinamibacteria bacterium]|jgi:alanine dehydrogenase|nr:ornithine cyclodeaminase family protein [Vicinamibacteria bacterium]
MILGTLVLTGRVVRALLGLDECMAAVEAAFRDQAEGRTWPAGMMTVHAGEGGFHVKTAGLVRERPYFAAKLNSNFPGNPERSGLPTIQGVVALCDGENGRLLALLDSIEITLLRTGAATAVAAKYLARRDAHVATICGCGVQGRVQLRALKSVLPLESVRVHDADRARALRFAEEMGKELCLDVRSAPSLEDAVRGTEVCVTCTPSRQAFLMKDHVAPGTFVAAVGADNPSKQELDPQLMSSATVVVDVLDQCASSGDLHHALDAGAMRREDVHAELADVIVGRKRGRGSRDEITVFDSTGTALEDVAAAVAVYERALSAGVGLAVALGD